MTNLNFKRFAVAALLLLGFSACNKEVSEPQYSEPSQSAQPKTELIYLDMISSGSEEMRLAQKVNTKGATTGVFLEEKDLAIQIAVRRKGTTTFSSQLLRFQKIKNAPRARYTGFVEVPAGTGNEVEIAGIVLGEWTGDSKTEPEPTDVKFMTKTNISGQDFFQSIKPEHLIMSEGGVVRTKLPYIVDWTTAQLTASEGGKQRIQPVTLQFKPSGTILRIQLRNSLDEQVKIGKIKVKTNTFVDQWQYNFSNGLMQASKLIAGDVIAPMSLPLSLQTYTWTLKEPIILPAVASTPNSEPTKSEWLYTWIMGNNNFTGTRKIEFTLIGQQGDQPKTYENVFKTSAPIKYGETMWVKINLPNSSLNGSFDGSMDSNDGANELTDDSTNPNTGYISADNLPLSSIPADENGYVQFIHEDTGGYRFISGKNAQNTGLKYYNWTEAVAQFHNTHIALNGIEYSLPNIEEWNTIFPQGGHNYTILDTGNSSETVQFPSASKVTLISQYKGAFVNGVKTLYALRFKSASSKNLTAYRYECIGSFQSGSESYLKITCRYLGAAKAHITMDNLSSSTYGFWDQPDPKEVVRYFRALGYKNPGSSASTPASNFGTFGYYWASTPFSPDETTKARNVTFGSDYLFGYSNNLRATNYFPVILFKR